jgi:hypothetical protein
VPSSKPALMGVELCASRSTVPESTVILRAMANGVDRPEVQSVPVRTYFPFAFAPFSLALANQR